MSFLSYRLTKLARKLPNLKSLLFTGYYGSDVLMLKNMVNLTSLVFGHMTIRRKEIYRTFLVFIILCPLTHGTDLTKSMTWLLDVEVIKQRRQRRR
jgi:hypothetical protein